MSSILRWLCGRLLFVLLMILLAAYSDSQDTDQTIYFTEDLQDYYYAYDGDALLIHCEAVELTEDREITTVVHSTVIKNSVQIDMYNPPDRHYILSNENGIATGLLILPSESQDSGCTVRCAVIRNGLRVVTTRESTIYVGDGTPIAPISDTIQLDETLNSVTIDWGKSPVPDDDPLDGYNINVTQISNGERLDTIHMQTEDNATSTVLYHLTPGAEYEVVIAGRNSHGEGAKSRPVVVEPMRPVVPPPPVRVEAVLGTDQSGGRVITVTWRAPEIDFDTMTPIDNYVIFYYQGVEPSSLQDLKNISTTTNDTRTLNITGISEPGAYMVGVAAVNSAGRGSVEYISESLDVPAQPSTFPTTTHIIIVAALAGAAVLLLCMGIVIILICVMRVRTKKLERETARYDFDDPGDHIDGSPYSKKRGSPNSSKKSDNVLTNSSDLSLTSNELHIQEYGLEPRRAGSRSPPPFESIINGQDLNASSTFKV